MNKKLREAKIRVARRLLVRVLLVVVVVTGILLGWAYVQRLNAAAFQAEIAPIRELIIDGVYGAKSDAPIDPKTGDVYFPQAKLYLPNTSSYLRLTYAYDNESGELSVGNKAALNQGITSLYNAQGFRELFDKVPYLQACQRGVTVTHQKLVDAPEKELRQTVQLANGKTAYLYIEKACPELHETAELLKDLKSY